MLRELLKKRGVSGDEREVRDFIYEECKKLTDDVRIDALGNVIAVKKGTRMPEKLVMGCAHMDEVGLIITGIEDDGLLKFEPVGGMDARILLSKRVLVGSKRLPGVIGSVAIHFLDEKDLETPEDIEDMAIDIGANNKKAAEEHVEIGDTVIFDGEITEFGDGMLKSRALDDRVGCAILLEALKRDYPAGFAAVFSVQEEVGTHGARTASYALRPDAAIVLEGTTCADMHGVADHMRVTRVGKGAAVTVMDNATVPNTRLRDFITSVADSNSIAWQYREGAFGGTDAGAIQRAAGGAAVAHISTPCRYIHSPVSAMKKSDFEHAKNLFITVLGNMDQYFETQGVKNVN